MRLDRDADGHLDHQGVIDLVRRVTPALRTREVGRQGGRQGGRVIMTEQL